LDFIGAKATLAREFNCIEPLITEERTLELVEARHPLLEENLRATGGAVVPVSFSLDAARPVMVISGANAGGKTVVLKTAGLLSLMALSGLHVPARAARFPLYASVLADIGDRQSLAANLSTFTAHISNIRQMLELCHETEGATLVLLDEVGTGTDPEEGSALGVAVVDHFRRECGAHVVATTHYSGLKMYAAQDEGVLNASVEFDEKTLQPTYRLIVGLAGASSGLDIARRFGFPEVIIGAARERVDEQTLAAADYLRSIKRESEEAEALRRALEEERAAVADKYATLDVQARKREREREAAFAREMQTLVADFERRSQELYGKIEDRAERIRVEREAAARTAELRREAQRAAAQARALASTTTERTTGGVRIVRHGGDAPPRDAAAQTDVRSAFSSSTGEARPAPAREIRVGDRVRLRTLGTDGIVERLSDGEAELLIGSLRFKEKVSNLELLQGSSSASKAEDNTRAARLRRMTGRGTEVKLQQSDEAPQAELNLIGRTTDEASDEADKFLDEAYMQGLSHLRIVHGIGTGALRRTIANLLHNHPHVATFAQAPQDQGGAGATVVELKQ
jgi:DNA mismatch repair protein MutS2